MSVATRTGGPGASGGGSKQRSATTPTNVRRYADHLRAGHYIVGVAVGDDEAAEQRAADDLRAVHPEFLTY